MIYKHYERKEHIAYFFLVLVGFFVLARVHAATSIGTDVQSDGNYVLSSSASSIVFANGWRFAQTTATTTQVTVTDSVGNTALIFDEN